MWHDMELDRSTYEVLQILGISKTKLHLRDLFSKTKFNDVNDRSGLMDDLFDNFKF